MGGVLCDALQGCKSSGRALCQGGLSDRQYILTSTHPFETSETKLFQPFELPPSVVFYN